MLYTVKNLPTLHNYVAAEESAKDNLAVHESFAEDILVRHTEACVM